MFLVRKGLIIIVLVIISLFWSCRGQNQAAIEIYLVNRSNYESVYDNSKNEFIYADKFEAAKNDLKTFPLISESEIINIDTVAGTINLSKSGVDKIIKLQPNMKHGIPFAICVNRVPVFTGYFWSTFSSYGSTWNCIQYNHTEVVQSPTDLLLYKGNGLNASRREKIKFSDYPELIHSLAENQKIK